MTSCPRSSDDSVTTCSAIHVAGFRERRSEICVLDRPLLVFICSLRHGESSFFLNCFPLYRCVVTVRCVCWPDQLSTAQNWFLNLFIFQRVEVPFLRPGYRFPYQYYSFIIITGIQPLGRFGQRPELSQSTGMALVRCILGK